MANNISRTLYPENTDDERLSAKAGRMLNPFMNRDGTLINPYIDYRAVLNSDGTSSRVKRLISEATGIEQTTNRGSASGRTDSDTGTRRVRTQQTQQTEQATPGETIAEAAKSQVGTPYSYGGSSKNGFDCSGLAQYASAQAGLNIPRTAAEQYKGGASVATTDLKPGDLVFFVGSDGSAKNPGHVGVYIGGGQYVHAPQTGETVKVSNLSSRGDYIGARRYY